MWGQPPPAVRRAELERFLVTNGILARGKIGHHDFH